MNIDDRLDALAQTVELLAAMHKDNEIRMQQLAETISKRNARLENLVTDIAEGTLRLLRTVEAHEQRISNLEDNRRQ